MRYPEKLDVICFHGFMTSLQSKYTEEAAAKGRGIFSHLVMIRKQQACVLLASRCIYLYLIKPSLSN